MKKKIILFESVIKGLPNLLNILSDLDMKKVVYGDITLKNIVLTAYGDLKLKMPEQILVGSKDYLKMIKDRSSHWPAQILEFYDQQDLKNRLKSELEPLIGAQDTHQYEKILLKLIKNNKKDVNNFKIDVYSLGIVLLKLINQLEAYKILDTPELELLLEIVITKMINPDHKKRSINGLLKRFVKFYDLIESRKQHQKYPRPSQSNGLPQAGSTKKYQTMLPQQASGRIQTNLLKTSTNQSNKNRAKEIKKKLDSYSDLKRLFYKIFRPSKQKKKIKALQKEHEKKIINI